MLATRCFSFLLTLTLVVTGQPLTAQIPNQPPPIGIGAGGLARLSTGNSQPARAEFEITPREPQEFAGSEKRRLITGETETGEDVPIEVQYPNTPLTRILIDYEEWTGLKIIRDANIENVTVSIETTGAMPRELAIRYVEASLLLNGYAFVPAGEGMVKILAVDAKKPQPEGLSLFTDEGQLPDKEVVVTFVATLKYLSGEDAVKAIDQAIPRHSYGVLQAIENTQALLIIENTVTVRAILALLRKLDVPPRKEAEKSFQLVRADAEDVAAALSEILGIESSGTGGGVTGGTSGTRRTTSGTATTPAQPRPPAGSPDADGTPTPDSPVAVVGGSGSAVTTERPPKIIPIPRLNRILVIATPETMQYISRLVDELDAPAELRSFVSRRLNYLTPEVAMGIIGSAINRGNEAAAGTAGAGGVTGTSGTTSSGSGTTTTNSGFGNNRFGGSGGFGSSSGFGMGGFGSSGFGGGGLGGGFGGGGFGGGGFGGGLGGSTGGGQPLRQSMEPSSLVVGKTLLISDPSNNTIFASGPPEHLRVLNEILDELDKRPKQISISVVIGEMNLSNNFEFGLDYILKPTQVRFGDTSATTAGLLRNTSGNLIDPNTIEAIEDFGTVLGGLTAYGSIDKGVDVLLRTLAGNRNFQVISRPTLLTMNNQPAEITSGTSIPVPTTSTNSLNPGGDGQFGVTSQIQFQPIVLALSVTPLINSDNELTLQISQQNNEQSGSTTINGNPFPNISQQTLTTTVMVQNGSTVLLGGLIRENTEKERNGLPFLKDMPLVKHLVSSVKDNKTRRELLVFIQPRIVQGDGDLPPSYQDSAGQTPFGDKARSFMNQEHAEPEEGVRRSRLGELFYRLLHSDAREERMREGY